MSCELWAVGCWLLTVDCGCQQGLSPKAWWRVDGMVENEMVGQRLCAFPNLRWFEKGSGFSWPGTQHVLYLTYCVVDRHRRG